MPKPERPASIFAITLLSFLGLFLTGCSIGGSSRPSEFYVLGPLPADTQPIVSSDSPLPDIGIGQVQIPAYLDRPQIVTKISDNQIHLSEFHRWGESLQSAVTRVLRENTVTLLGGKGVSAFPWLQPFPSDFLVHVVIVDFEAATHTNTVTLRAIYRITNTQTKETILVRESEFRQPIGAHTAANEYQLIVEAMSAALAELSRQYAQELIQLPASPHS